MKNTFLSILGIGLFVFITSCNKKQSKAPVNPASEPAGTQVSPSLTDQEMPEFYYINGLEVPESKFNKDRQLLPGQEMVTLVQQNGLYHHFFSNMNELENWAATVPDGNKLIQHLTKFDDLAAKAERDGEIDYFEKNGKISETFHNYLSSGEYNYVYTPANRVKSAALGQFMKNYSSFGPSLPVFTFPHVGSSFDNQISYHQAIGIGWVSIFDKSFWRSRLKTFWFVAYTNRTYWGWYYDNKTTSVSLSF